MIYFVVLDIDECAKGTHNCSVNAVCKNIRGSYNCTCKDGYHGDGIHCTGINMLILILCVTFKGLFNDEIFSTTCLLKLKTLKGRSH